MHYDAFSLQHGRKIFSIPILSGRTFGVSEHFSRQIRHCNPASAAFLALKGRFCARYNPETGVKTKQGILQPRFLDDSDNEGDQVDDDAIEDRNQADSHPAEENIGGI